MKFRVWTGHHPGVLLAIAVLAIVGWYERELVVRSVRYARELGPVLRTYNEMRTYKTALLGYRNVNRGQLPRSFREWVDVNFNRGVRPASEDLFGRPYRLEAGRLGATLIRSCGPDQRCRTRDDLVVELPRYRP